MFGIFVWHTTKMVVKERFFSWLQAENFFGIVYIHLKFLLCSFWYSYQIQLGMILVIFRMGEEENSSQCAAYSILMEK